MLKNNDEDRDPFEHDSFETDKHDESRSTVGGGNQGMKAKEFLYRMGGITLVIQLSEGPFFQSQSPPKTYQKQLALKDFDDFDPRETSTASQC